MNVNKLQNTSFQKKLVAYANVIKNNQPYPCAIYKLEKGIDCDYFIKQGQVWKKAKYLQPVEAELENNFHNPYIGDSEIYVIENKKEKCLGYCHQDTLNKGNEVITLEVHPRYKHENGKRKVKYIGETLLAFLAKLSQRQKKPTLKIDHATKDSRPFYTEKCGFDDEKNDSSPELKQRSFNALIKQNEKHTKGKIIFVEQL